MKSKISSIIISFLALFSISVKCQNSFELPKGYKAFKDYEGKQSRIDADFDGDGIKDLAILCENKNEEKIVVVYLGSKWLIDQTYWWFPWDYYSKFSFSNNVLTIDSGDEEFSSIVLKLRYYAKMNNMRLIGYAKSEYVRVGDVNTGGTRMARAFSSSINLSTGEYQVNDGVKKKIKIAIITLSDIEKYFEYLSQVGQDN
jgi:hypothetical protein